MAGFRNHLVHLYWEIDDEQIYGFLQEDLGDFDEFARYVVEFINREDSSN